MKEFLQDTWVPCLFLTAFFFATIVFGLCRALDWIRRRRSARMEGIDKAVLSCASDLVGIRRIVANDKEHDWMYLNRFTGLWEENDKHFRERIASMMENRRFYGKAKNTN